MRAQLRLAPLLLTPLLLGAQAPDPRARLIEAQRAVRAAEARAAALTAAAGREADAAKRAQAAERALAGRVDAAAARVRAASVAVAVIAAQQEAQRRRLAQAQRPAARLLGAVAALARQPMVATVAQPGSVDDLVHIRAVLGVTLPAMRAETAGLRSELAQSRRLAAAAAAAVAALEGGRTDLDRQRRALAALALRHGGRAVAFARDAIGESDRALALGEQARDLVDAMAEQGAAAATGSELAGLPGPPLRPRANDPARGAAAYRLPVRGRLVTGLGEVSAAGVRSRGLSFAVEPGAEAIAPAGGTVRYAGRFRGYGTIVLIDHGDEWTSLITGLGMTAVRPGQIVAAGARLGRAHTARGQPVTVELRRRGRPVDIGALL